MNQPESVHRMESSVKHKHDINILAVQPCSHVKPPRELKEIFDQDTGTMYIDLTD